MSVLAFQLESVLVSVLALLFRSALVLLFPLVSVSVSVSVLVLAFQSESVFRWG